jgi:BirA family biotin operon repressor/biotin-[acetyl-CoA-carboxylase] ligase
MDLVDRSAEAGEPAGLVVVADHQTAGRGRAGRTWIDRPGSALLCSVLLRPRLTPPRVGVISLLAGVALAEAIEELSPARPTLRWPNDLLIEERKLAGILATSRLSGRHIRYVNLGVGVNLTTNSNLPDGSAALAEVGLVDRDQLLTAFLNRLGARLSRVESDPAAADLSDWESRAAFRGEIVTVSLNGEAVTGQLTGVDGAGALLIWTEHGQRRILAGDLVRGPRPTEVRPSQTS